MQSNGGVSLNSRICLFPTKNVTTGAIAFYAFDPNFGFNDPVNGSQYKYRVEEIIPGRTPTISRIILTYRDLGIVTATFSLAGTTDAGTVVNGFTNPQASTTVTLGNAQPTGVLFTKILGLSLTAQNLQLLITRTPNAGPLSIAKLVLCGRVERQAYS